MAYSYMEARNKGVPGYGYGRGVSLSTQAHIRSESDNSEVAQQLAEAAAQSGSTTSDNAAQLFVSTTAFLNYAFYAVLLYGFFYFGTVYERRRSMKEQMQSSHSGDQLQASQSRMLEVGGGAAGGVRLMSVVEQVDRQDVEDCYKGAPE